MADKQTEISVQAIMAEHELSKNVSAAVATIARHSTELYGSDNATALRNSMDAYIESEKARLDSPALDTHPKIRGKDEVYNALAGGLARSHEGILPQEVLALRDKDGKLPEDVRQAVITIAAEKGYTAKDVDGMLTELKQDEVKLDKATADKVGIVVERKGVDAIFGSDDRSDFTKLVADATGKDVRSQDTKDYEARHVAAAHVENRAKEAVSGVENRFAAMMNESIVHNIDGNLVPPQKSPVALVAQGQTPDRPGH